MASYHHRIKSGKKGTAVEHAAYITRQGKHRNREDLIFDDWGNMPAWAENDPAAFWKAGDLYERANGAVYREHEIALPGELTKSQQLDLVNNLVEELVGNKPYQFAVHAPNSSIDGAINPHLHLMYSDREDDGIERAAEDTFSRYNAKAPEQGGRKKASGGKNKMQMRDEAIAARKTSATLQNAALEAAGHDARVDHRTLKEQGVDRTPERHLGPARIRQMSTEEKQQHDSNRQGSSTCRYTHLFA